MRIFSPDFAPQQIIPAPFTCQGENKNPNLQFEDVPAATQSLVLIVEDIDAQPKPWVHWLVFNIPGDMVGIAQGTTPPGSVEGLANGGTPGYEGPCPKYFSGTHHYQFTLYALDTVLDVPAATDAQQIREAMQSHLLAEATLTGTAEGTQAAT